MFVHDVVKVNVLGKNFISETALSLQHLLNNLKDTFFEMYLLMFGNPVFRSENLTYRKCLINILWNIWLKWEKGVIFSAQSTFNFASLLKKI